MIFSTERLRVEQLNYDIFIEKGVAKLYSQIVEILSPAVTKSLPGGWNNINTHEKAKHWMNSRLAESKVLSVSYKENQQCIGFIFLYDMDSKAPEKEYRFGYLLAESFWGKGLGTELIKGLVRACIQAGNIASLSGGVERDNLSSHRVLEKIGFSISSFDTDSKDTVFYEYQF